MGGQGMTPCTSATLGISPAAHSYKECIQEWWGLSGENLAEPTYLNSP